MRNIICALSILMCVGLWAASESVATSYRQAEMNELTLSEAEQGSESGTDASEAIDTTDGSRTFHLQVEENVYLPEKNNGNGNASQNGETNSNEADQDTMGPSLRNVKNNSVTNGALTIATAVGKTDVMLKEDYAKTINDIQALNEQRADELAQYEENLKQLDKEGNAQYNNLEKKISAGKNKLKRLENNNKTVNRAKINKIKANLENLRRQQDKVFQNWKEATDNVLYKIREPEIILDNALWNKGKVIQIVKGVGIAGQAIGLGLDKGIALSDIYEGILKKDAEQILKGINDWELADIKVLTGDLVFFPTAALGLGEAALALGYLAAEISNNDEMAENMSDMIQFLDKCTADINKLYNGAFDKISDVLTEKNLEDINKILEFLKELRDEDFPTLPSCIEDGGNGNAGPATVPDVQLDDFKMH